MELPADGSRHAAMAETSAVRDFYQRYVPDDETSDASDSLRVFKGLVVLRLMNADGKPALVGPVDDLFIGSLGAAYNRTVLEEYRITHVLTIGMNIRPKFPDDYTYMCLQVRDAPSENLSRYFDDAVAFIDEALAKGGRVLCHCFAGRSRSSTVVCAYLMRKHRLRLDKALQLLRVSRPQAQPNAGFMMQLRQLEKQLFGEVDSVELSVQPSRSIEAAGGELGDPPRSQNDDAGSHNCVCSP